MKAIVKYVRQRGAAVILMLSAAGFSLHTAHAVGKSPAPAYDVTLENLSFDIHGARLSYPKIEIRGANIPKAEIEEMLAADMPVADRLQALKRFSANSVEIPATDIAFEIGQTKLTASCSGNRLEKIAEGRIGKYSTIGCTGQLAYHDTTFGITTTLNATVKGGDVSDYNVIYAYRLWADKGDPDDQEAAALHGPGSFGGATFSATSLFFDIKGEAGKITVLDGVKLKFPVRPLKDLLAEAISAITFFESPTRGANAQWAQNHDQFEQAGVAAIDFLENMQFGTSMVEGYSFTETIKDSDASAPFTISVGTGKAETKGADRTIADIRFSSGNFTGTIGALSWQGFPLLPLMSEFERVLNIPNERVSSARAYEIANAAGERVVLALTSNAGTLSLRDLDIRAAGIAMAATEEQDGDSAGRTPALETMDFAVKLKNAALKVEKPFKGVPTAVRLSFDNLRIPTALLLAGGRQRSLNTYSSLKILGVETSNSSFAVDLNWDPKAGDLIVNEYRVTDENFGSVTTKGRYGNVTENLFSGNLADRLMALDATTIKNLALAVDIKGGRDKLLLLTAVGRDMSFYLPESLPPAAILQFLLMPYANMSSSENVEKALLAFWENPGKLGIAVKAKSAAGLSIRDLALAQQDPKSLDDKLDITATATR